MSVRFLLWRNIALAMVAVCVLVVALLGAWSVIFSPPVADNTPSGLVAPSRRTTYITEPLRADGSVDYLAALNQRCSQGVTPEDNASVLIWQAIGPGPQAEATRAAFFKAIEIAIPADKGDYFVPFARFARHQYETEGRGDVSIEEQTRREEEIEDQLYSATTRAWAAEKFPLVAAWLQANEKPLALLIEATRRSRRFDPLMVRHDVPGQLLTVDLPMATESRSIASALVARAMLRLTNGQIEEAWQDLLAVHRLSRLVAQGEMMIEWLVGNAIKSQACAALRAILQIAELSPTQIECMLEDLDNLPPFPSVVDKLNLGERFTCLDSVYGVASQVSGRTASGEQPDPTLQRAFKFASGSRVDWDLVFTRINSWWDREIAACRQPDLPTRNAALDELHRELEDRTPQPDVVKQLVTTTFDSRRVVSECMADLLLALLLPAASAACGAEERGMVDFDLTKLAIALAGYRADHGTYPETLGHLVPGYLTKVPGDVFAGAPLHYQVNDRGYVLQSVGPDGERDEIPQDGMDDAEVLGDDLIVRMRAAVPPNGQQ